MKYFQKNNEIFPVLNGKWGQYCKKGRTNFSTKTMQELGYQIVDINKEQAEAISNQLRADIALQNQQYFNSKLENRYNAVNICLLSKPVKIVKNSGENTLVTHVANLGESGMIEAYEGCGKGTAYIKDNMVIAFHYGYDKPVNAPNLESVKVELSCTQLCFSL